MNHDHFHAHAQVAVFAIMKIAFLLVLAATILITVLRLVGLGFRGRQPRHLAR